MGDEMATDRTHVSDSITITRFELRCLAYWIGSVTAMNLQRQTRVKHLLKIITLEFRAYFNQDLQPQNMEIGQSTIQQLHIYTGHFRFATAQIVINCTLKYALLEYIVSKHL